MAFTFVATMDEVFHLALLASPADAPADLMDDVLSLPLDDAGPVTRGRGGDRSADRGAERLSDRLRERVQQ